jgi:hypothetical protein
MGFPEDANVKAPRGFRFSLRAFSFIPFKKSFRPTLKAIILHQKEGIQ